MTSIAVNSYTPQLAAFLTESQSRPQPDRAPAPGVASNSAATVTLSQAALAALGDRSTATVIADAEAAIESLLTETGRTSLLDGDELAVDLSRLDRRELFAVSSNAGDRFSPDRQEAASLELQRRFDTALAGPAAVMRITGDVSGLYELASDYLDSAGAEEKASTAFRDGKAAVEQALAQLAADPNSAPRGIANDPVADYLQRASNGEVAKQRDISAIANDVRAALDKQYRDAGAEGQALDLSRFGGRSLSAIVLNTDSGFSTGEMLAAKAEVNARLSKSVQSALSHARASNDPSALSKNLIAQYASLSSEERQAAGLTPEYFETIKSNYETSVRISEALGAISGSGASSGRSGMLGLIDFL